MAKILVKLKEHSFLDLYRNQYIMSDRPYVVEQSPAIESICAQGKMSVLCNTLKPEATDELLQKHLAKSDVNSFLAKYDANTKLEVVNNNPKANANANPKK